MRAITTTDFKICRMEVRLRVASCENGRITFLLVLVKFNCLGFINHPRLLLVDAETTGPRQFNRRINFVFDGNCKSRSKSARDDAVEISVGRG